MASADLFLQKKKKKTETRRDTNKSRLSNFKFRTSMKSLIHVLVRDVKSSRAVIDVLITTLKQLFGPAESSGQAPDSASLTDEDVINATTEPLLS